MEDYLDLSRALAKKQMQEKIRLEIIYEFLIIDKEKMQITRIEDLNIFNDKEYMSLVDDAIAFLNKKTNMGLVRKKNMIYLGKSNKD